MSRLWLLLMLVGSAVWARDPFAQPVPKCVSAPPPPASWRLLGVVGSKGHLISYWQTPDSTTRRLATREMLGQDGWQIVAITLTGVTLVRDDSCQTLEYFYPLKKGYFDAQRDSAFAVDKGVNRSGRRVSHFPVVP